MTYFSPTTPAFFRAVHGVGFTQPRDSTVISRRMRKNQRRSSKIANKRGQVLRNKMFQVSEKTKLFTSENDMQLFGPSVMSLWKLWYYSIVLDESEYNVLQIPLL